MPNGTLEERKSRHLAFWRRQHVDRPLLLIHRPTSSQTEEDAYLDALKTSDLQRYGTDPDIIIRRAKQNLRRTTYLGDALPLMSPPLGPTMLSAFLGARVEIAPSTVWFHPTIKDIADLADVSFDSSNQWWQLTQECVRRAACEPDAIPVVLGLGSLGDSLANLVGGETLMLEMLERPELVKTVLRGMLDIAKTCYARLYEIAQAPGRGTANWLSLWSPGRTGILENDFSIMLSTEMYKDFFAVEFDELSPMYDYRLFHVDGTRSQQHIGDFLVHIPGLNGCQLGSNPGTRALEVLPVIKHLQTQGKCVYTYVFPDEIEDLFAEISPRGFCMVTAAKSDEEAESIIERLTNACREQATDDLG